MPYNATFFPLPCLLFSNLFPVFVDFSSDLSVPLAGETWRTPGGGHADNEFFRIKAEVAHQACVPPPVQ